MGDQTPGDDEQTGPEGTAAETDTRQAYIDQMARKRGYVLDYHKIMARQDWDVLVAANRLVEAAYLRPRLLDAKTKELLFILSLVVMRGSKAHIQSHIKVALEVGATAEEILEAIEIALPEAGVVAFQHGLEAWAEFTDAERLEPSRDAISGRSAPSAEKEEGE
jgi:4-carboxymuconolactone decarboxylase